MQWFNRLIATHEDWALTVARVFCGGMMFAHGAQKALGIWGGSGFAATMEKMSGRLPEPIVFLVIAIEFLGAAFLVLGLLSRLAALGVVIVMAGAMITVHGPNGFFASDKGVELNLLYTGLALVSLIGGGGAFSIDRAIQRSRRA
jgi:putative oxidoreductase